jgi:hypothetical protein
MILCYRDKLSSAVRAPNEAIVADGGFAAAPSGHIAAANPQKDDAETSRRSAQIGRLAGPVFGRCGERALRRNYRLSGPMRTITSMRRIAVPSGAVGTPLTAISCAGMSCSNPFDSQKK